MAILKRFLRVVYLSEGKRSFVHTWMGNDSSLEKPPRGNFIALLGSFAQYIILHLWIHAYALHTLHSKFVYQHSNMRLYAEIRINKFTLISIITCKHLTWQWGLSFSPIHALSSAVPSTKMQIANSCNCFSSNIHQISLNCTNGKN